MKKRISTIILVMIIMLMNMPIYADSLSSEDITAEAGILIDERTGTVLFGKNEKKKMYPASTTKMLTAIIILENHSMDEVVTIDPVSPQLIGSRINLDKGEIFTVEQLINALMVKSANDAARALAVYHAGSIEEFSKIMNNKAKELGAFDSNFVNPNGLHDNNHYTTAYDLAMISRYCMQNDKFRQLVSTVKYQIPPTNKQSDYRYLLNKNRFLSGVGYEYQMLYRGKYIDMKYDIVDGIKTGFTGEAGNCLASSAKIGNQRYIAIILKSPGSDLYINSRTLLDYGFENFNRHQFVSKGSFIQTHQLNDAKRSTIELVAGQSLIEILPKSTDVTKIKQEVLINKDLKAPIAAGEVVGKITYLYNNIEIARAPLVSEYDVSAGDLVTSVENTFIIRDENNNVDIGFYVGISIKFLISFVIYRLITNAFVLRRRKKNLIIKSKSKLIAEKTS